MLQRHRKSSLSYRQVRGVDRRAEATQENVTAELQYEHVGEDVPGTVTSSQQKEAGRANGTPWQAHSPHVQLRSCGLMHEDTLSLQDGRSVPGRLGIS